MASMRKLRRRLLRWQRYTDRVAYNPRINQPWAWQPPRGFQRAVKAVHTERERRDPPDRYVVTEWGLTEAGLL